MKKARKLTTLAAIALLTPAALLAQEGREAAPRERASQERDAVLRLPNYVRARTGPTAFVNDPGGTRLGTVHDYVVDRKTGRILSIAVAVSAESGKSRSHLVPWDRFAWDDAEHELRLRMAAEEIENLPIYEPSHAKAGERGKPQDGAMKKADMHQVASSETVGTKVVVDRKPIASVSELLLETRTGVVAFALAAPPEKQTDPLLVPWQAMSWDKAGEGEPSKLRLSIETEKLDRAPRLEEGNVKMLENTDFLREVYAFYGLMVPPGLGTEG